MKNALLITILFGLAARGAFAVEVPPSIDVGATPDFEVTGEGGNPAWETAQWHSLSLVESSEASDYTARFKLLHSETGLYVLFEGTDSVLTASMTEDFSHLWEEDVFEIFLWPDETYPLYFEYEISPLETELPILIPNLHGKILGWRPWDYEGDRKVRKATHILGGEKTSGAAITGWRAEVFIPYALLTPLGNVPPAPRTTWRANVYRIDRDFGKLAGWSWAPVTGNFHEFKRFGTLRF